MTAASNTTAVVIGVEAYAVGRGWNLNGPALDAVRFAAWLVNERGVDPGRVALLVSPLPENEPEVAAMAQAAGLRTRAADETTVRDVFSREVPAGASDFLIVFVGGHGVLDDEARRVFYADATSADKRNLDLTNLLRAMRSSTYQGHPHQLVIVDACLTLVEQAGWKESLPDSQFAVGRPAPTRDQRAIFSASAGERAVNDDALRTGLFAGVVRDVLQELPEGTWPPDADALRDAVSGRMAAFRAAGRTSQIPSHIWYRSRSGEDTLVSGTRAGDPRSPWPLCIGTIPSATAFQERPSLQSLIAASRGSGGVVLKGLGEAGQAAAPGRAAAGSATSVLSGGGGTGKTQLAAWFATNARQSGTDLVVWADASDLPGVVSQLAAAAEHLGLTSPTAPPPGVVSHEAAPRAANSQENDARRMVEWLSNTDRTWLLVLDDIVDPSIFSQWWPRSLSGTGWVIGTTRRRDAVLSGGGRALVPVDVFTPEESLGYLAERLDLGEDTASAAELAQELGHLPLALSHAAAYMIDQQLSCAEYLAQFLDVDSRLDELMPASADADSYSGTGPRSAERTVAATWSVSIRSAMRERPVGMAAAAASLAALLDPAGHPEQIWATEPVRLFLGRHRPSADDAQRGDDDVVPATAAEARQAVTLLHRFGLLTLDAKAAPRQIRMHALAQRATLESGMVDIDQAVEACVGGLLEAWDESDLYGMPVQQLFRSNVRVLLDRHHGLLQPSAAFEVSMALGMSLVTSQLGQQAKDHCAGLVEQAPEGSDERFNATLLLALAHEISGEFSKALALDESLLAGCSDEAGEDALALRAFRSRLLVALGHENEALHELRDLVPRLREKPELVQWYYQAAGLEAICRAHGGDPEAALEDLRSLVDEARRAGQSMEMLWSAAFNIVHILQDLRRSREARDYMRAIRGELMADGLQNSPAMRRIDAALQVDPDPSEGARAGSRDEPVEASVEPTSPATASGARTTTRTDLERQLQLLIDTQGPRSPETLYLRQQALLARTAGADWRGTVAALRQLLAEFVEVFGPDFPQTLTLRSDIAGAESAAGRHQEALADYRALLVDRERVLGPDHPATLGTRHSVAYELGRSGEHEEALTEYRALLADRLRALGAQHPDTLSTRHWIGRELGESGDHEAALAEFRAVLADRLRILGEEHPDTLSTRHSIARELGEGGDHESALVEFRALLADRIRILGAEHPDVLLTRHWVSHELGESGDHEGAVAEYRTLVADRARVLGADHTDTLSARYGLAHELGKTGDHAGSLAAFRPLLTDQVAVLGRDDPDTLSTRQAVAVELGASGDHEGALAEHRALLGDRTRVLGAEHPDTLNTRKSLAFELAECGDHEGAEAEYRALLADRVRIQGADHQEVLDTRRSIAHLLTRRGNHEGALTEYRALLADQTRALGPDHPETLLTRQWIAQALSASGNHREALVRHYALLADRVRVLGADHENTLSTRYSIAFELGECGDHRAALAKRRVLLAEKTRTQGRDQSGTLAARETIAAELATRGDHQGALAEYRALLADRIGMEGAEHPNTLQTRHAIARELGQCGDPQDALAEYEALLADQVRILGPDHPDTFNTRHSLMHALRALGRHEEAAGGFAPYVDQFARVAGADNPSVRSATMCLARELDAAGDHEAALRRYEDLLAQSEQLLGPDHPDTLRLRGLVSDVAERDKEKKFRERIAVLAGARDPDAAALEAALGDARAVQTAKNAYALQVPLLRALLLTPQYAPGSDAAKQVLDALCVLHDTYGAIGPDVDRDIEAGMAAHMVEPGPPVPADETAPAATLPE